MRRRALLAAAGLSLAAPSSGCLDAALDAVDSTIRLGWLGVTNYDSEPHRFRIQVSRDGDVVHDSTRELAGATDSVAPGEAVECTWDGAPGSYRLRGRVDDRPWVEQSLDAALDGAPDCATARTVYDDLDSGELEFHVRAGCDRVADYSGGCRSVEPES